MGTAAIATHALQRPAHGQQEGPRRRRSPREGETGLVPSLYLVQEARDHRDDFGGPGESDGFFDAVRNVARNADGRSQRLRRFPLHPSPDQKQSGLVSHSLTIRRPAIGQAQQSDKLTPATTGESDISLPSWAVADGVLPPGIQLRPDGTLRGKATATGTYDFTVRATDKFGYTGEVAYSLVVGPAVQLLTTSLPDGSVGTVIPGGNAPDTENAYGGVPSAAAIG